MWSCGGGCPFILLDRDAELHGEAIKASAQDLRIEVCRPLLLDHSSSTIERHNEILSRRRNTVLIGPPAEKGNDGRLPIDEGSTHQRLWHRNRKVSASWIASGTPPELRCNNTA